MKVTILGAGAFGLALASIFHNNKLNVTVWSYSKDEEEELIQNRVSSKLKEYKIPNEITITTDIKMAIEDASLIVFAVPAHALDSTTKLLKEYITCKQHILIATKGIENETCALLTDVIYRYIKTNKVAVLSGPSFASDVVKQMPIGFSLATINNKTKSLVKSLMENSYVKIVPTRDVIGVQMCGAVKNVIAISTGLLEGMKMGEGTKALFLTLMLNDVKELIKYLGGKENTILTLAGLGDILMTSTSKLSRNFTYGKLLGEGKLDEAKSYLENTTVEGIYTLKSLKQLLKREHVNMYIISLLDDVINNKKDKKEILEYVIYK